MGKFKLIAKARLLDSYVILFALFAFCFSLFAFFGDLSLVSSYVSDLFRLDTGRKNTVTAVLSCVGTVLLLAVCPPLRVGRERWFILKASGEKPDFRDLFFFFKKENYPRSMSLWFYSFSVKLCALVFFLFPGACLAGVAYYTVLSGNAAYEITISLIAACILVIILSLSFFFVFSSGFFMYWQTALTDSVPPGRAYAISRELCRESTGKICLFRLGFIPWWLLCVFVFPIFYVWGYRKQAQAVFCRNEEWKTPKKSSGESDENA